MRERLKQNSKEHDAAESEKNTFFKSGQSCQSAGFGISHRLTKQWTLLHTLDHFWSSPKIIQTVFHQAHETKGFLFKIRWEISYA